MAHTPVEHAAVHKPSPPSPPLPPRLEPNSGMYEVSSFPAMVTPNAEERKDGSSSSSSSTSDSDSDDLFFQLETHELGGAPASSPSWPPPTISIDRLIDLIPHHAADEKATDIDQDYRRPPQVTVRYDVPDPNRIPASVFARNPASAMEWSVASNESLFSIQMGNSSFSRDRGMYIGKPEELGHFASAPSDYPPPLPPAARTAADAGKRKPVDPEEAREAEPAATAACANAEAMKLVMRATAEGKEKEKENPPEEALGHSISKHSDGSTTSIRSTVDDRKNESMRMKFEQQEERKSPVVVQPPNAQQVYVEDTMTTSPSEPQMTISTRIKNFQDLATKLSTTEFVCGRPTSKISEFTKEETERS
ncbi:hypothetical protein AXF42_Ash019538 [Apostasia shenzhenica]|uniref:Uncharacterized protein n=1 Tax=Apostasia shenzhenica TaxID=1088818 RepID=A0A2I0A0C7_9ASPA|nr:hypothetical protein AXF42_Ash019538 [Apostasia shenzhenica]